MDRMSEWSKMPEEEIPSKSFEFDSASYKHQNGREYNNKLVESLHISETDFEKRYMKHFLLFENRQANLYWIKAYNDLK
jgi:hypothetical protein